MSESFVSVEESKLPHSNQSATYGVVLNMPATLTGEWSEAMTMWLDFIGAGAKTVPTLGLRKYHVRRFARSHAHLSPFAVDADVLSKWLSSFDWKAETVRSYQASLRSFYKYAHITGKMATDPAAMLPTVSAVIGKPRPCPEEYYRSAIRVSDERVGLMLELAGGLGMRRGEVAVAHRRDVVLDALGDYELIVHGKGKKDRIVPLERALALRLLRMPDDYFFPGQIRGHLSPPYVGKLISRSLPEGWTAHTLRHRFAGVVYAHEPDIRAVQELLGHASVRTTQIYTPVPAGKLRSLVAAAA